MALSKIKGTVIADDAINADRIADGTVVASDLLDNTLTGAKLATDIAITTSGNITTTGAFTSTGIDDNATSTAITINSSEQVAFTDGTASLPSITNLGDENTGMFFPAANQIGFATTGSERVRIDGAGSVFIGANSIALSTSQIQILFGGIGSLLSGLGVGSSTELRSNSYYSSANQHKYLVSDEASRYKQDNGTHGFDVAPTGTAGDVVSWTRTLTINNSGNVGIGTSSPNSFAKLHIVDGAGTLPTMAAGDVLTIQNNNDTSDNAGFTAIGGSSGISYIQFGDSADKNEGAVYYYNSDDSMRFLANASERMRINNSGNVGIGTTPSAWGSPFISGVTQFPKGSIACESNGIILFNNAYYDGTNYKYIASAGAGSYAQTSGLHIFNVASSGTAGNNITFSEAMRIDSSGNVGIGTSSPSQLLEVSATSGLASGSGTTNAIRIADVGAGSSWSTTQDFSQLQFSSTDTSNPGGSGVRYSIGVVSHDAANTYSDLTFRNYDGTEHMRINGALGRVGIGTSAPNTTLEVESSSTSIGSNGNLLIKTSEANTVDTGGQLTLGNISYRRGSISGRQESSSGTAGYLQFGTRGSSGDITERMRINSSGSVTKPNQPAFSVYASADQNNVPLGYTTILNNTEVFDTQGNYNTSTYTFTAPVDGKYYFSANVNVINVPLNAGWIFGQIATSNGSKTFSRPTVWYDTASGGTQFSMPINGIFYLDANDTAYVRFYQHTGSAGVTDIVANRTYGWFDGYLLG